MRCTTLKHVKDPTTAVRAGTWESRRKLAAPNVEDTALHVRKQRVQPLNLQSRSHGLPTAAPAGKLSSSSSYYAILTTPQHILPLAGLTAGLALYPRSTTYAEEPLAADPIRQIVSYPTIWLHYSNTD